jgi:hypothetical protein
MIQQTSDRIVQYQNEMKILILYGAIGSMATVDSALFSSSVIRVIKMIVLPLFYISLNLCLVQKVLLSMTKYTNNGKAKFSV